MPEQPRRRARWLLVVSFVWAAVLVGAAIWSIRNDRATARDQTTAADARPTVDEAVGRIDAGAAGERAVVAIGPYQRTGDCQITAARAGGRYVRVATVYTPEGTEDAVLERVARALPERYGARVTGQATRRLTADAGNFVAVNGSVLGAGEVRFVADAGCRNEEGPEPAEPPSADADRAPVEAVLSTLGARAAEWRTHRVPCPSGGPLWTVEAVAAGQAADGSVERALRDTLGETAVIARPDLYAFRKGPVGLVARNDGGRLVVSATTDCQ